MLKKTIVISSIAFLLLLSFAKIAMAAVSPTPAPAVSATEEQINNLKDRIASRVAQLNLVEKKGFIATVTDISETQITATDTNGDTRIIDVDELTKFSSPSTKSSFGISDISKGATIGLIGLYNKDSRHLLARWVDVLRLPQILSGGIVSIDKNNFTLTVATEKNPAVTIDIEDITKTLSYTKVGGVVRSGFSHLAAGQRILLVGFRDAKNPSEIIASRITIFPDVPINPRIPMINPTDIAPVTSTGSGKKLTPITK